MTLEKITDLFNNIPQHSKVGYSFESHSNTALTEWFDSVLSLAEAGDNYVKEDVLNKLIFLYPVFKKTGREYNRVFCTLALKYYQSLSVHGKQIKEIMAGAYKNMLKWEEAQAENEVLSHHYIFIINEYLNFLDDEGDIPPYLDFQSKQITDSTRYRRLYFEHPTLRRELYCDLWYPSSTKTKIILYHLTGFSSRKEQQKRRSSHPDNFTRDYLKLVGQFTEQDISLCVIPCPYEDVYKAFIIQYTRFINEELFPVVEQVCGCEESKKRGLSAFSKGSFYAYSLAWEQPVANAIITHSGALLELFTQELEKDRPPLEGRPILVTCGKQDSLYKNNRSFFEALQKHKVFSGSYFYNGTHDWQDVQPTFRKGLRWLVQQLGNN